ncbi:MAG: OadG family protein [Roseburia sp.]|uniref:OadG family transporter subunit n=1 Tax=Roseburia sp. 831b TaxID=1261635 RepID=UPI000952658E|nr:OadG family transporter subunit [Roseburia sp. 831b]MCI5920403.1 OadG family protein [Roseburia sp.]MDD6217261.1 OadG family transporter subunit [Roseburia sp.]MDY5883678.1 OadG family transporter subunit [Roseburia sp.]WVK74046.1 OadG family transporter subunit [Roseburia sp. 831b]
MKKKLSLVLIMCFFMLALSACGTDPTTVDYNGYSYSDLEQTSQGMVQALMQLSDEEKNYYRENGDDTIVALVDGWDTSVEDVGAYQGLGEFTVTKSGKTLSTEQVIKYENRDVVFTMVFSYNDMKAGPTSYTVDKVYTTGEKMAKAGLNTLMGMGTVFVVLILISLIIYCFNIIPYLQKKKTQKNAVADTEQPAVMPSAAPVENLTDDLELVAVISAAIAASTGTSTDSFVVRSIHRR